MQYGGRGYSGDQRLYTPSLGSRRGGQTLPNILWKSSGVVTRPTSGLHLTVRHVDVPHGGTQGVPPAQRRPSTRSEPSRTLEERETTAGSRRSGRSSLQNTRLLSRPQQTAVSHTAAPSTHVSAPKASRTMLPPITPAPPVAAEPPAQVEEDGGHSSTDLENNSSPPEDSDSEDEVCAHYQKTLSQFFRVLKLLHVL